MRSRKRTLPAKRKINLYNGRIVAYQINANIAFALDHEQRAKRHSYAAEGVS
jgi:hypothetical protein